MKKISVSIVIVFIIMGLNFYLQKKQPVQMAGNINSETKEIENSKIPFEYLIVSGKEAIETCLKLREDKTRAITPVIFGGKEKLKYLFEAYEQNSIDPKAIINEASDFNITKFIKSRTDGEPELYSDPELIGEWPTSEIPKQQLIASSDILSGKPLNEVYIGMIPTVRSYEVPAFLKYGGWNDCPSPKEHVGIMKYWSEKYDAKIISITDDTIECTVENPPKTKTEAMALAKEQFIYCPDIVLQGTNNISTLAALLMNAKYWFFWWD